MPLHSVIMPVYNGERYLADAVRSVLAQTCGDLELILVNDCSSDSSPQILAALAQEDSRIRVTTTQMNSGGPATPKNVGLRMAQGRFISFCDQDDILLPNKLQLATEVFEKHPDLDVVFFDFQGFNEQSAAEQGYLAGRKFTSIAADYLVPLEPPDLFKCERFLGCMAGIANGLSTQTVVCRREALANRRFDTRFRIVDDTALWLQLAEDARIGFCNRIVAQYRHHDGALTTNSPLMSLEALTIYQENFFRKHAFFTTEERRRYRRMLANFCISSAAVKDISKIEKRSYLARALSFDFNFTTLRWLVQTLF